MKKLLLVTFTVIITSIILGCSESFEEDIYNKGLNVNQTKNSSNFVTLNCVQALVKIQHPGTRSDASSDINILCYEDAEHDTLLYICDKIGGGWTIYAPDMRVPPVLAQSETGTFAHASENEALMAWVATMAEDMKIIKHASDAELNFTPSEIESNKKFWRAICFPDDFAKEIVNEEIAAKGSRDHPFIPLFGHYELCSVEQYTVKYDSIQSLIHTHWSQYDSCNNYCPFKTSDPNKRAPAGCVAIAGAQMLKYLHDKLGVPITAPSFAYCNSDITAYPNYDWNQSNPSSTIWDIMDDFNGDKSGPLVANIGKLVGMHYGNDGSTATTVSLVNAFNNYGISCVYGDYNITYLTANLLDSIPVVLRAATQVSDTGHVFIADRYLRVRNVTKTTYMWVYDSIPLGPDGHQIQVPILPDRITYTYSSPYINMIGMNWGWGYSYFELNEWFTLSGDWIKYDSNYNQNRKMIYNFSVAN